MDDITALLLSRYLDGDLGPAETRDFEDRLRRDAQLEKDLAALRDVRGAVAAVADRDEPPAELDRLMEPLRRGVPEGPKVRPWLRWAGMAAAAVLALTVVYEVDWRAPAPELEPRLRDAHQSRSAEPTRRFALAPLPTASTPEEEQPLGAADRLLASPMPEREVAVAPPVLEVLGPLNNEEEKVFAVNDKEQPHADEVAPGPPSEEMGDSGAAADAGRSAARKTLTSQEPTSTRSTAASISEGGKRNEAAAIGEMAPMSFDGGGAGRFYVAVDGETIWRSFDPKRRCPPGRHIVRVDIAAGVVVKALPFGGVQSLAPAEACAADLVHGLKIEGVADGEYRAEVVVEAVGSK
ncbi:MAG: hypothetical protein P8Y93_06880 [Acidobacteriota bacterium]